MTVNEAINKADALRMNTIDEEQKAKWVNEVDCDIAEMMGVKAPKIVWPEEDAELLMKSPHDNIYFLYLVAMYDYYNQETALYENDMAIYNNALKEAKAYYRRHNTPKCDIKHWRVM